MDIKRALPRPSQGQRVRRAPSVRRRRRSSGSLQHVPQVLVGFQKSLPQHRVVLRVILLEIRLRELIPLGDDPGLKSEAKAAGASKISITANAIINGSLVKPQIFERAAKMNGFTYRQINKETAVLTAPVGE